MGQNQKMSILEDASIALSGRCTGMLLSVSARTTGSCLKVQCTSATHDMRLVQPHCLEYYEQVANFMLGLGDCLKALAIFKNGVQCKQCL